MTDIELPNDNFVCEDSFEEDMEKEMNKMRQNLPMDVEAGLDKLDEDTNSIIDRMNSRRKLSEKLENDREYRRKYIEVERDVVNNSNSLRSSDPDLIEIRKIVNKTYGLEPEEHYDDHEDMECFDVNDIIEENDTVEKYNKFKKNKSQKNGVYIHKVNKLIININL